MIRKYKPKATIIEAIKLSDIIKYRDLGKAQTSWVKTAIENDELVLSGIFDEATVHTLEGHMKADKDDYIIQGLEGEIYPCKPNIFNAKYEVVK